jgi:hypothetical protein
MVVLPIPGMLRLPISQCASSAKKRLTKTGEPTQLATPLIREELYKGFLRGNGGGRSVHSCVRIDKFAGDEGLALGQASSSKRT